MFLKRRDFGLLAIFACASITGIGTAAYLSLRAVGDKFLAERFLFFALSAGAVFIFLLYRIFAASRRTLRELEKIIDLSRYGGIVAEDRLERFGDMGRRLKSLYHELGDLSRRRADRIYLLSGLAEGLLGFIETPVLVVEPNGKVLYAGEGFLATLPEDGPGPVGRSLTEVLPGIFFKEILAEADKTHGPVESEADKKRITFYPLFDHANKTAAFIAAFGKKPAFSLPEGRKKGAPGKESMGIMEKQRGILQFFQERFKRN